MEPMSYAFVCVIPLASLRSEEVILKKSIHLRLFVDVVAMQTMYNACVPMLFTREGISQIATVKKLWDEDWGAGDKNILR